MAEQEIVWSVAVVGLTEGDRREFKSHVGRLGDTVGKRLATLICKFNRAENAKFKEMVLSEAWLEKERLVYEDLAAGRCETYNTMDEFVDTLE